VNTSLAVFCSCKNCTSAIHGGRTLGVGIHASDGPAKGFPARFANIVLDHEQALGPESHPSPLDCM
jgi:hypothetical protein